VIDEEAIETKGKTEAKDAEDEQSSDEPKTLFD
jgi:hypothetical protein